ncbi:MAG: hypothetical protein QME82_07020, partial [Bacillota bacterium]|nr:hypothetical protein [Bacillota bacterium]
RCMPWDRSEWDREMLNHYRTLARLRRRYRALRRGEYATLVAGSSVGELFAFARWDTNSCLVVLMNNSEEPAWCDPDLVRRRMAEVSGLKRWAACAFRPVLSVGGPSVGGAQARNLGAHNSRAVAPSGGPAAACHSHALQYIARGHYMGAAAAGAGASHVPGGLRPGFPPQGGAAPSDGPSGFAGPNSLEGLEQSLSTPLGWQRFAVSNGLESPEGRDAAGRVTKASTNPPCAWPLHPGRIHLPPMSALVYILTRVSE